MSIESLDESEIRWPLEVEIDTLESEIQRFRVDKGP